MVWDNERGCPARLGGSLIADKAEWRANAAASILTRIYSSRLDALAKRQPLSRPRTPLEVCAVTISIDPPGSFSSVARL